MSSGGYFAGPALAYKPRVDETEVVEIPIPTGKMVTPTATKGAIFQDLNPGYVSGPKIRADHAAAVAVSPDGRLLAILTSGWNRHYDTANPSAFDPALSNELVFLFDITGAAPRQLQALQVPNTFQGLAWRPSSTSLFVSGGKDDIVYEFVKSDEKFVPGRVFKLGHGPAVTFATNPPRTVPPMTGALACSPDGLQLLVANPNHDWVSLIDLEAGKVRAEQDLRPGKIDPALHGQSGGSYPRSVVWTSNDHAYAASERDREIVSLKIARRGLTLGLTLIQGWCRDRTDRDT